MPAARLTRRASLLLPFILAACGGGDERTDFTAPHYDYLPTIPLNVATLRNELRFVPAKGGADLRTADPIDPIESLQTLLSDRIKAVGAKDQAVVSVRDASLVQRGDQITGTMESVLEIITDEGQHVGYVEARVRRVHTGRVEHLRTTLFELTVGMLDDMNVELEFQVRKHLKDWISDTITAAPTPVTAAPLANPSRR